MCKKRAKPYRIEKELVTRNLKKPPVQKVEDYLDERIAKQSDKEVIPDPPKMGGIPVTERQQCKRQVYTTQEIAEKSLDSLVKLGIHGEIERCKFCGFLHIAELRG